MPRPSKFTQETRGKIIQALSIGASRRTAAHIAGVDESQLRRWFARGRESEAGTSFRDFYEAVLEAEAAPRIRALGVVYKELPDHPGLAWKYIERKEPGYEPPLPAAAPLATPTVIQLSFADGTRPALTVAEPVLEGEVVDEDSDSDSGPGGTDTATFSPA